MKGVGLSYSKYIVEVIPSLLSGFEGLGRGVVTTIEGVKVGGDSQGGGYSARYILRLVVGAT